MFIVTATNVTRDRDTTNRIEWNSLEREDGTADYDVSVGINDFVIWRGSVNRHKRDAGAAALLRLIADKVEANGEPFHG